jgi:hypothetical protein
VKPFARISVILQLARAQSLEARGEFQAGLRVISSIYATFGEESPTPNVPVSVNLRCASLACRAGEGLLSYNAIRIALSQLECGPQDETSLYLMYYCKLLLMNLTNFVDSEAYKLSEKIHISYENLNIKRVQKRIIRAFPIGGEVGKEYDRIANQNAKNIIES